MNDDIMLDMMIAFANAVGSATSSSSPASRRCHFVELIEDGWRQPSNFGYCAPVEGEAALLRVGANVAAAASLGAGDKLNVLTHGRDVIRVIDKTPPSALRHRRRPILTHPAAISEGLGHSTHGTGSALPADEDDEEDVQEPDPLSPRSLDIAVLRIVFDAQHSAKEGVAEAEAEAAEAATRPLFEPEKTRGGQSVAGMFRASSYGALVMQPREKTRVLTLRLTSADVSGIALAARGDARGADGTASEAQAAEAGVPEAGVPEAEAAGDCPMLELADLADERAFSTYGVDVTSVSFREYLLPEQLPSQWLPCREIMWSTMAILGCAPYQVLVCALLSFEAGGPWPS